MRSFALIFGVILWWVGLGAVAPILLDHPHGKGIRLVRLLRARWHRARRRPEGQRHAAVVATLVAMALAAPMLPAAYGLAPVAEVHAWWIVSLVAALAAYARLVAPARDPRRHLR